MDNRQLAKVFNTRNNAKIILALDTFNKTGYLHHAYMEKLARLPGIDQASIEELQSAQTERYFRQLNLFVKYFDQIQDSSDRIIGDARYRNITANGIGFSSMYVSRKRLLTIRELLYHYSRNALTDDACCGRVLIVQAGGSPMSGMNNFTAFCQTCHKMVHGKKPSFGSIMGPIMRYDPGYAYEPSSVTVEQMIAELGLVV